MFTKKKVISLILLISLFSTIFQYSIFANISAKNIGFENFISNRYTQQDKKVNIKNRLDLKGYKKILENNVLEVWHKEDNASIRIVDKRSGYIWGGLKEEKPEDMNTTWAGVGNSLLTIEYFDYNGLLKTKSIAPRSVDKEYKIEKNKLIYHVNFKSQDIQLDFEMSLNNNSITFKVLNSHIKEGDEYKLASIYFFPFLGSTRMEEIEGYMFVPDGCGALIRFSKPAHYLTNFEKRIYGKDYGIDNLFAVNDLKSNRPNDFIVEEPNVVMPVFGVVHGANNHGVFAYIQSGAEYSSIVAYPSGLMTNYNWVSNKFIYRQKYMQPTSKSGSGIQVAQKNRNKFDAQITYYFLTGNDANYVGMSKLYRKILIDKGVLNKKKDNNSDIPIHIETIAADIKKGFIFDSVIPITTTKEMKNIVNSLNKKGIKNIDMSLLGWQSGGINGQQPSNYSFEKKIGTKEDLLELQRQLSMIGGNLFFTENFVTLNEKQINLKKEGGINLSQALIYEERDNKNLWFYRTYFMNIGLVSKYLSDRLALYKKDSIMNIALKDYGYRLYSENKRGFEITRNKAVELLTATLSKAKKSLNNIAMYRANEYVWKYTDKIFDAPMVNSQYLFETDTVPFLQLTLKGYIDYFTPYINLSFYAREDILKAIEYGAYPSFIVSGIDNFELKDTALNEIYSTKFSNWYNQIVETYNEINSALKPVKNQEIVNRNVLQQGIVKVDYKNGYSIIVNYTQTAFKYKNIIVPAKGWRLVKEGVDKQ